MASSGKKKTTMAKLMRESRLRERRLDKQAKKDARKQMPADHADASGDTLDNDDREAALDNDDREAALDNDDREAVLPGAGQPTPATAVQALADA
jgi:hypothetical protein